MDFENLVAEVHRLRPGDILVVKVPSSIPNVKDILPILDMAVKERLKDTGIRHIVVSDNVTFETWSQGGGVKNATDA
jgi:hypothetical protein